MVTLLYCRTIYIRYNKVKVGKKDKELFLFPTFKPKSYETQIYT